MTIATAIKLSEKTYCEKPLKVDREKGIIYNVRLLGENSLNGRDYSLKSRHSSARLYEEMPVNLDHSEHPGGGRSISDNIGVVRGNAVSKDDGAVYGDFHYITSHPMADAITERAEKFPTTFGFSHDAVGEVSEGAGTNGHDLVEDIIEVNSIDLVSNPATNKSLFESESRSNSMAKTVKTTVCKILEANKTDKRSVNLLALMEQSDEFAAMAEAPVEMAAEASGDEQVKAAFRAMVIAAFDDEALDTKATMARIKEIMNAQDKLNKKPAPVAPEGESDHVEVPALEAITKRLDNWDRRQLISDVLEDAGLSRTDLESSQRKLIEKQTTEDDMRLIIEGLDIQPAHIRGEKPKIGVKIHESESQSYDDLLLEARGSNRRNKKRA